MRHVKTREKFGYRLLVQERTSSGVPGSGQKTSFNQVGGLFQSRDEIHAFIAKHPQYQGRKIHIEGVRLNVEPLAYVSKRENEPKSGTGTHR